MVSVPCTKRSDKSSIVLAVLVNYESSCVQMPESMIPLSLRAPTADPSSAITSQMVSDALAAKNAAEAQATAAE